MAPRRFDSFAHTLDNLPVQSMLGAIKLEYWMLENDLLYKRVSETKDVDSIRHFCQFIIAVIEGDTILPRQSPARHVAFYRETVLRLIRAGELPDGALKQFDHVYSPDISQRMAC
jgi:hypothetical protein